MALIRKCQTGGGSSLSRVYAEDQWQRACQALRSAETLLPISADDAASRAYYAAFHAVSALFATQNQTFSKHTAIRAAVHRDLVRTGAWSATLGEAFDALWELRNTGDYGSGIHVSDEDAVAAVTTAREIIAAVAKDGSFN